MESMADGVLLVRRELGHSLARRIDRQEQRVVAKAVIAAALVRDNALTGALAIGDQAVRIDERNDAHKARGAVLVCHAFQIHEQLGIVGGIVAVNPGTGTPIDVIANGLTYALQYLAMCILLVLSLVKSGAWARDIVSGF